MNGSRLVAKLKELGYSKTNQLDVDSLDWIFENPSALPFLSWLCQDVKSSNVLSPDQLNEFSQLKTILHGGELESALRQAEEICVGPSYSASPQKQIEELESEVELSFKLKESLVLQRNQLSIHHNILLDKLSKLESLEESVEQQQKIAHEQAAADNALLNDALDELTTGVAELYKLYNKESAPDDDDPAAFLSQIKLNNFHKLEEQFSQEVTEFTRKQFFQGISDIASSTHDSDYKMLDISNPDCLQAQGTREELNLDDCKELARLHAIHPKGETKRIEALLREGAAQAATDFFENKLQALQSSPLPNDTQALSVQLQESERNLCDCQKELSQLSEVQLPALLKDSANLQVTNILTGDYDLKIARQDYFTSKQDELIALLICQRARFELLSMAYDIELKNHKEAHHLLSAIRELMQKEQADYEESMKLMNDPALSSSKFQRSTVDSRDHFLNGINSILNVINEPNKDSQQLFVTHSQIQEGTQLLVNQKDLLESNIKIEQTSEGHHLSSLEASLHDGEHLLYPDSSSEETALQLTPSSLNEVHLQLNGMLLKLEKAVIDIVKDVDSKKKMLKGDQFQLTERELFVYFMNDADQLRQTLKDVESRLSAHLVK